MALCTFLAFSQTKPDSTGTRMELFFTSPNMALPLLFDAAIAHAAEMEQLQASKEIAQENITQGKRQVLSGIGMGAGYNYGSRIRYSDTDQSSNPWNPFDVPVQPYYNIGVNVSFSLLNIINRRSEVNKRVQALKQVESNEKLTEREIRKEVITLYQELVLARKVMETTQDAYQSASLSKQIAEQRFSQGQIQVDEQMEVIDYHSKAALALEEAKNTYITSYLLLEERIGTTIQNLMNIGK